MWAQHDVYSRALGILIDNSKKRWRNAEDLLGVKTELGASFLDENFDHHVVQDAHDLLAAIWRLENGLVHPRLPNIGPSNLELIQKWISWLHNWTSNEAPSEIIRAILFLAYTDPDSEHSQENLLLGYLKNWLKSSLQSSSLFKC